MEIIMSIIGTPLGYIMWACYKLANNYGGAIIIFTFITKLILFPVAIKIQKNSIKMVKMRPMIEELKKQYPKKEDKEAFMDAQMELYAQEKYSPAAGCLPLLIQLPIIFGLIDVIYKPLKHLLHLPTGIIDLLQTKTMDLLHTNELSVTAQLKVIEAINDPKYFENFRDLSDINGNAIGMAVNKIQEINLSFLGLDLSGVPTLFNPGILLVIPALSGLSSLALSVLQNRGGNVLQAEQGKYSQLGMTAFLTAFSLYFAFLVPAGIGLYWIMSNVFAIVQMYILNKIYDPAKFINYDALEKMKKEKRENKQSKRKAGRPEAGKLLKAKEKQDYKKFFRTEEKQLVFYSEKSGFYKYFENVIDELLIKSEIIIHYVTSDPDDAVFSMDNPQIVPYYIGGNRLIPFMMKMDADIVVMTMPDLDNYHIKRSYVRKDIEYIFMFHGPLSMHMAMRKGCVDNFDTIFCVGPHVEEEIRKTEEVYGLKPKLLIQCGYGLLENLTKAYEDSQKLDAQKKVLIAPSWQKDNIMDSCLEDILENMSRTEYQIIVRPHPEYTKRYSEKMDSIIARFSGAGYSNIIIETEFKGNESIFSSDLLISDWSGIAYEYAFATLKPVLFINTPVKIMNPEYHKLGIEPLEITLREKVGRAIEIQDIKNINCVAKQLIAETDGYQSEIRQLRERYFYNFGLSGRIGAEYIMDSLSRRNKKEQI
jgi:YidC/Oxa1 family membrane protein insertase